MDFKNSKKLLPDKGRENREIRVRGDRVDINSNEMNSKNSGRLLPDKGRENRDIQLLNDRVGINSNENLLARDVTRAQDARRISKCTIFYIISIILSSSALIVLGVRLYHLTSLPEYSKSPESSKDVNEVIKGWTNNETIPDLKSRLWGTHNNDAVNSNGTSSIGLIEESHCKPIHNNVTKPFRKSLQKCLEYQSRYVYPCRESATPNEGMVRLNHCNWRPEGLIIDGENAYFGEFPHMVLLGYDTVGDDDGKWKCGGVLLSEKFVLTAAHCTSTERKEVKYIRIGILFRNQTKTPTNMYTVKRIYRHPRYRSPYHYHDIALLEMNEVMQLDRYALPACLHDGSRIDDSVVIATGWGTTEIRKHSYPLYLQKVTLEKYSDEYCGHRYRNSMRRLNRGYDKRTQVCYGDKHSSRDTCEGDSGGPTQIKHPQVKCMYLITSIISFGKWCGDSSSPGLYTRVAHYLDWIESIVWTD
ncbi:unnamed protein product, partial [Brenthis ino]